MANIIEHKKFVMSQAGRNANKFWEVKLFDNNDIENSWGRIGVTSQSKIFPGAGRHFMDTKIREKLKKGYKEVNIIDASGSNLSTTASVKKTELKDIATKQIEHSDPEVTKLITYLVQVNRHDIATATHGQVSWNDTTGLFTTPLGIVTPENITEARSKLNTLADFVVKHDYKSKKFISTLEEYLTLIPQNIGMKFIPEHILPDVTAVQKQNSILDALDASYIAVTSAPKKDTEKKEVEAPKIFDVKLHLVSGGSKDEKRLFDLFYNTRSRQHTCYSYRPVKAYAVEMPTVKAAFEKYGKPLGNVMELFHGSNASNVIGIIAKGLIIPPASSPHVTARMWQDGVYTADCATKSLNYSAGFWGGSHSDRYFMFICEVALGKWYIPKGTWDGPFPKPGYDSVFAKAGRSGVLNNEYIVYRTYQVNLTHLLEFSPK